MQTKKILRSFDRLKWDSLCVRARARAHVCVCVYACAWRKDRKGGGEERDKEI